MTKTSILNLDERAVGARLRRFREEIRITRVSFALSLGVGPERIASYEAGRVPLKFEVYLLMSQKYRLHPKWLATGEGANTLPPGAEIDLSVAYPRNISFSKAYVDYLASRFQNQKNESEEYRKMLVQALLNLRKAIKEDSHAACDSKTLSNLFQLTKRVASDLRKI